MSAMMFTKPSSIISQAARFIINKRQPLTQFYLRPFSSGTLDHLVQVQDPTAPLSFNLTEDQKAVQELTRKFVKDEIIPRAAHHDRTGEYPWAILKMAKEVGILNAGIPEKYGGPGLSLTESCIIAEELGFGCTGIGTSLESTGLGQAPIIIFASDEQKKKYLGRLAHETDSKGNPLLAAYCVTEPGTGSDVAAIKTKAEKNADGDYVLNGSKMWITNGGVANWYFVLARTNSDPKAKPAQAFSCFIVDADSPGKLK